MINTYQTICNFNINENHHYVYNKVDNKYSNYEINIYNTIFILLFEILYSYNIRVVIMCTVCFIYFLVKSYTVLLNKYSPLFFKSKKTYKLFKRPLSVRLGVIACFLSPCRRSVSSMNERHYNIHCSNLPRQWFFPVNRARTVQHYACSDVHCT